ncbi:uncharacterized protein V2V93DRAFT_363842 [Kockiozyma suomiensis]|uniref:uncharacterized protein n=1 Tax=Kockiozyma suomiensis TaxID=1337062 RepID=UPI003343479C
MCYVLAQEMVDGIWALNHQSDRRHSKHNHDFSTDPLAHHTRPIASTAEKAAIADYVNVGLASKKI